MHVQVSHSHAWHTSLALSLHALRTSPSPQLCELVAETLLTHRVAKIPKTLCLIHIWLLQQ